MSFNLVSEFLNDAADRLLACMGQIDSCLARLNSAQVWHRHSEAENAIGNLMLHLTGNLRQFILSGIGGAPDTRERPLEFSTRGGIAPEELQQRLRSAVEASAEAIRNLEPARIHQPLALPVRATNTFSTIMHVVTHFYGHTYQIIYATKLLTSQGLEPAQPNRPQ
jgi:hypothetical protein